METQAWLDHALTCRYISDAQHRELDEGWQHIGAMLNRMIEKQMTAVGQQQTQVNWANVAIFNSRSSTLKL